MSIAPVVNRRDFLKTGTAGGVALVIGFHLSPRTFADQAAEQEKKTPNPLDAWVWITPDNRVTLILGKSEMGQGIMTALPISVLRFAGIAADVPARRRRSDEHFARCGPRLAHRQP